mmetsp:Transcript_23586/g.44541  ORF Transcript_23586/g.44541 Transcript_23586/m.44541 type:complete len:228 (-) Transcript_23586:152-835(-)
MHLFAELWRQNHPRKRLKGHLMTSKASAPAFHHGQPCVAKSHHLMKTMTSLTKIARVWKHDSVLKMLFFARSTSATCQILHEPHPAALANGALTAPLTMQSAPADGQNRHCSEPTHVALRLVSLQQRDPSDPLPGGRPHKAQRCDSFQRSNEAEQAFPQPAAHPRTCKRHPNGCPTRGRRHHLLRPPLALSSHADIEPEQRRGPHLPQHRYRLRTMPKCFQLRECHR